MSNLEEKSTPKTERRRPFTGIKAGTGIEPEPMIIPPARRRRVRANSLTTCYKKYLLYTLKIEGLTPTQFSSGCQRADRRAGRPF